MTFIIAGYTICSRIIIRAQASCENQMDMEPLVINFSQEMDWNELVETVAPDLTITRLPFSRKRLTGEEIALSIALGVAGNATFYALQKATERLVAWLSRKVKEPAKGEAPLRISISSEGVTVDIEASSTNHEVEVVITDWVAQFPDDQSGRP